MRSRPVLLLCLALGAGFWPGSAGGATPKPARSVLDGLPGLEKAVSYTETKIPLAELIQKVAADTGVALSASREVADEPVAVVVKDMPAHDLLLELADLLDYQWRRQAGQAVSLPGDGATQPGKPGGGGTQAGKPGEGKTQDGKPAPRQAT